MRCTYMYSFKCGAIERNEVDLDWIYIDIWMVTNRGDEKKKRKRKKNREIVGVRLRRKECQVGFRVTFCAIVRAYLR